MLLLAIDTTGKEGGITLAEGDENTFRLIESAPIAGGTFSAQLVPALASLLHRHGFVARGLEGLAALSGPGSFTGLRVGLSAVKGLAEGLKKPIAAISLLEAMALSTGAEGKIAAAVDAGRGEFYFGLYEVKAGRGSRIEEKLLAQAEIIDAINRETPARVISCDANFVELAASAGIVVEKGERPGSGAAARIGLRKLLSGDTVGVEELDANYIRRSDAEIFSKRFSDDPTTR